MHKEHKTQAARTLSLHLREASQQSEQLGFSLVELLVVLAVMLILVAFAIPIAGTTVDTFRLRGTLGSTSNLLQRCRMQAARQNVTQRVHFATDAATNRVVVFVTPASDTNSSTTQLKTDPNVVEQYWFPSQFRLSGAPSGTPAALTGLSMWNTSITVTNINKDFYFDSRGLPCDYNTTTSACPATNGFVQYFKYASGGGSRWAAVSLSPAGRIQSWFYDGGNWGN